jgi:hypothetical protein
MLRITPVHQPLSDTTAHLGKFGPGSPDKQGTVDQVSAPATAGTTQSHMAGREQKPRRMAQPANPHVFKQSLATDICAAGAVFLNLS